MTMRAMRLFAAVCLLFCASGSFAEDHAYTEGLVVRVSYVRTAPGKFDEYLKYLAKDYKRIMDGLKKSGAIVDWGILQAYPRTLQDPDLVLTTTYKNMAALDDFDAKLDPILKQVFSSLDKSSELGVERGKLRTELGSELYRQLVIK